MADKYPVVLYCLKLHQYCISLIYRFINETKRHLLGINNTSYGVHTFYIIEISDTCQFILNQVMRTSLSPQFVSLCFLLNRCCGLLCFTRKKHCREEPGEIQR